jgi:hypothetical protein
MRTSRLGTVFAAVAGLVLAASSAAIADPEKQPLEPPPWTGSLPGAGDPPGPSKNWADLMKVQARLDAAADKIGAEKGEGFAGFVVSAETGKLKVFWKGQPPAKVNKVIEAQRAANVGVDVMPARFSEKELIAAANRVVKKEGVTEVAPDPEGKGLIVGAKRGHKPTDESVPVIKLETSEPTPLSRNDDWAPYWGGARWGPNASGQGCSTGFAISIGGASKMLSAGHCGANGQTARDGGGQVMGSIAGDNNGLDLLYINAWSAGRIYDGGVGVGEFSKPVAYASRSYVGDWLCTSGSYSGAVCGIRVTATGLTINIGYPVYGIVRAEQVWHTNAAGNGDSGGPVFSLSADPNRIIAKGTITAGDLGSAPAVCTGVPASASRGCTWRMYYADIATALNLYWASIVTG